MARLIEAFCQLAGCALDFRLPQPRLDCTDNAAGDLVLQLENVVECSVEAVSPDMRAGRSVDDGTLHSIHGTGEVGDEAVARRVEDPTAIRGYQGIDDVEIDDQLEGRWLSPRRIAAT